VDCVTVGSDGCNGGWMTDAYNYTKVAPGVNPQTAYPYTATKGAVCKFNKTNVAGTVTSFAYAPQKNETALAQSLASIGPVCCLRPSLDNMSKVLFLNCNFVCEIACYCHRCR
jgi:hypothetical protein